MFISSALSRYFYYLECPGSVIVVQEDPGLQDLVVTAAPSFPDGFTKLVVRLTTRSISSHPHSLHFISTLSSLDERKRNSCTLPQDVHLNS